MVLINTIYHFNFVYMHQTRTHLFKNFCNIYETANSIWKWVFFPELEPGDLVIDDNRWVLATFFTMLQA